HPVDYPGNMTVYSIEVEIRPDNGQTLSKAGFQIFNPTGSIPIKGGVQVSLVPNVSANIISSQRGRYVVQVFNYNTNIAIDYLIRVTAGRTEGQPLAPNPTLLQVLSGMQTVYVGTYTEPSTRKGEGIPIFKQ